MFKLICSNALKYINIHKIKVGIPIVCTKLKTTPIFHNNLSKYSTISQKSSSNSSSTTTLKDLLIYKYENPKFFKYLNFFAIAQFMFWNYLSYFSFTSLKDVPINTIEKSDIDLPWWRRINLGENKYRNGIALLCFIIGKLKLVFIEIYSFNTYI